MKKVIGLIMLLCCVVASDAKDLSKENVEAQKKLLMVGEGLVGFSDEGLGFCYFKIDSDGNGIFLTQCQTGNDTQKSLIRNLSVDVSGFKYDLINEKTGAKDGYCTGVRKGFAVNLVFHNIDDTARAIYTLVAAREVNRILKAGEK